MLYTIGEIIAFILAAALLGGAIGWLARGLSVRSRIEERLEREVAGRQLRINTLEDDLRDAQAGEARAKEKVKGVNRQLDEQRDLTLTLEARLGEAESASEEMAKRLAARSGDDDGALADLEDALAAARSDLANALADAERAGSALADRDAELSEVRADLERALTDAEEASEAAGDDERGLSAELEELRAAHADLGQQHQADLAGAEGLRSELASRVRQIDELEAELEDLRARSGDAGEIEALRGELALLRSNPAVDADALQARIQELEADLADRDNLLDQLTDPEPEPEAIQESEATPAPESAQAPESVQGSEQVRAGDETRAAESSVVDDALADHVAEEVVDDAEGDTGSAELLDDDDPIAAIARRTSGGEPPARDDLQAIKGIGRVLEELLYSMGITSYRQIAQFTDDDIDVLNTRMGRFKDRMRRDAWMSQAADLHRTTHGTDV